MDIVTDHYGCYSLERPEDEPDHRIYFKAERDILRPCLLNIGSILSSVEDSNML